MRPLYGQVGYLLEGRLRNVILESSNLASLKPSPKIKQRERPRRVYYIRTRIPLLLPLRGSGMASRHHDNTSWRGLSVLLISEMVAMREPEDLG